MRTATVLIALLIGVTGAAQENGERPLPPPRGERGPPPELTDAQRTQLDALKAKMDAATTDEERESIHEEFRALFDSIRASNGEGGRPRYRSRGQETTSSSRGAQ